MNDGFEPPPAQRTHGSFRVGEGISLRIGAEVGAADRAAAEMHEWIHYELSDNTTFGWLRKLLGNLSTNEDVPSSLRLRAHEALEQARDACHDVEEGLATYRAVAYHRSQHGRAVAMEHRDDLPGPYRRAYDMACRLLGDPLDEERGAPLAAAIHVTCLCVGYAAMNVPIHLHYRDDGALRAATLPFITEGTPDERFRALAGMPRLPSVIRAELEENARVLVPIAGQGLSGDLVFELSDRTVRAISRAAPDVPMLTHGEWRSEFPVVSAGWRRALGGKFGIEGAEPQAGVRGREVILEAQVVRDQANPAYSDEVIEAPEIDVSLEEHRALVAATLPTEIAFSFLANHTPGEEVLEATSLAEVSAGASTYWLRLAPSLSGRMLSQPESTRIHGTLERLVEHDRSLGGAPHIWYTNPMVSDALQRFHADPESLVMVPLSSPQELLAIADGTAGPVMGWFDETYESGDGVLCVLFPGRLLFSMRMHGQALVFREVVPPDWGELPSAVTIPLGPRELPLGRLGRVALWGRLLS